MPLRGGLQHSDRRWNEYAPYYDDKRTHESIRRLFRRGGYPNLTRSSQTFEAMGAAMFYLCGVWLDADGLG